MFGFMSYICILEKILVCLKKFCHLGTGSYFLYETLCFWKEIELGPTISFDA